MFDPTDTTLPNRWEKLDNGTYRMKVPNGWVYSCTSGFGADGGNEAICFVPEENSQTVLALNTIANHLAKIVKLMPPREG